MPVEIEIREEDTMSNNEKWYLLIEAIKKQIDIDFKNIL